MTCTLGTLASQHIAAVIIVVTPNADGDLTNQASVTALEGDPNMGNNTAFVTTTASAQLQPSSLAASDLSITKADSPDPVLLGEELTYTLTVTNKGPSTGTGVTVIDTLPAGVSFDSAITSRGDCSVVGNIVICDMGELASNDSAIATIVVTPLTTGILNNRASVTGNQADPNVTNNTATQGSTANPAADLAVTMVDSPEPVLIGSNLTYTVTVTNHGPSDATGVTVRDFLPASVSFDSATASRGDCSEVGDIVTCNLGNLASSDSAIAAIVVTLLTTGILNNRASVTGDQADPNVANNTATQGTTANPAADLAMTMVDSPEPVLTGINRE